jgi:hypothetical protein
MGRNLPRALATAGMLAAVGTPATAASQATCQSGASSVVFLKNEKIRMKNKDIIESILHCSRAHMYNYQAVRMALLQSARLPSRRPGFLGKNVVILYIFANTKKIYFRVNGKTIIFASSLQPHR